ncbi:MAG TPA: hypothetical protein VMT87_11480 [Vicinamibacteria bacterium]|nr:hypothetical protein [Vicinamibacteria bacterium]
MRVQFRGRDEKGSTVLSDDRERVAEELRRIREAVRDRALVERRPEDVLGQAPAVRVAEAAPPPPSAGEVAPPPPRPDAAGVNALWDVRGASGPRGLKGTLARLVRRFMAPAVDAQVSFNARQVQLDNELLAYIDARLEATHRHYDAVLGGYGRHLEDIDKRHLILQEELVAHIHDLVKRIDLVLSESERGRLSLEFALRDLRARLEQRPR